MRAAIALGLFLALSPAAASAQLPSSIEIGPGYDIPTALHITAAILLPLGTAASVAGGYYLFYDFTCDTCGASEPELAFGLTIPGLVLVSAGLALGITATVIHARIRAETLRIPLPFVWGTPQGGGGGLLAQF